MLTMLRKQNPDFPIYSVLDPEFKTFGRVLDLDCREIISIAKKIPNPESGSSYQASTEAFESLPVAKEISDLYFGTMPAEIGYCWGHSNFLNATEWHFCNEINIAVTPMVLLLGHLWDQKNGEMDSSDFTAFYVPEGCAIEIYSSTLHFCPCEAQKEGFGCIVALPKGTNTDLEYKTQDPRIFRKNKWILSHNDNEGLKNRGVIPGIGGKNIEIKYEV